MLRIIANCRSVSRYFWFNYATGATSYEVPAELPDDLAAELHFDSGAYYSNTATKKSSWADPSEREWHQVTDPKGRKFWFNPEVCTTPKICRPGCAWCI
jgi:hypothetical protein